jgi:hypothetical protein
MDKASFALAEGLSPGIPFSFHALADHSGVSHATLRRRFHGGSSSKQKGEDQRWIVMVVALICAKASIFRLVLKSH